MFLLWHTGRILKDQFYLNTYQYVILEYAGCWPNSGANILVR